MREPQKHENNQISFSTGWRTKDLNDECDENDDDDANDDYDPGNHDDGDD